MDVLIANPIAGRGYARNAAEELSAALTERGIAHRLVFTARTGHATELAAAAAREGAKTVWAMGGDATLREVAIGLNGSGVPMGPIPCGTGNDLCRMLAIPARAPIAAYEAQQGGTRQIDLWQVNGLPFLNVAGIGFDVETLVHAQKFRRLPGSMLPYFLGVLTTVLTHKDVSLRLWLDGQRRDGDFLLFSMANGQYIGGGMRVAPNADIADGLLDLVMVAPVPKRRILPILPKFLKGEHVNLPIATVVRARDIRIHCERELVFQVDGELFPARDLHVEAGEHKLLLRDVTPVTGSAHS